MQNDFVWSALQSIKKMFLTCFWTLRELSTVIYEVKAWMCVLEEANFKEKGKEEATLLLLPVFILFYPVFVQLIYY